MASTFLTKGIAPGVNSVRLTPADPAAERARHIVGIVAPDEAPAGSNSVPLWKPTAAPQPARPSGSASSQAADSIPGVSSQGVPSHMTAGVNGPIASVFLTKGVTAAVGGVVLNPVDPAIERARHIVGLAVPDEAPAALNAIPLWKPTAAPALNVLDVPASGTTAGAVPATPGMAASTESGKKMGEDISERIRPKQTEAPSGYVASKTIGILQSMKSQSAAGMDPTLPEWQSLLPTLPVSFLNGALRASLAPASSSLAYRGEQSMFSLNLGMGYYQPERGKGSVSGRFGGAVAFGCNLAVGSAFEYTEPKKDLVLNAVWQIPSSGFRIKASSGYLWGREMYSFFTGDETVDVGQYSWMLAGSWIPPETTAEDGNRNAEQSGTGLHSIGVKVWRAFAEQRTTLDPVWFIKDTATDWEIWKDMRLLSEGELLGASLDLQFAPHPNIVAAGALGYEQVEFPFYDGTHELNRAMYSDLSLHWNPLRQVTVGAGWKNGVSENRFTGSLASGHWTLEGWYSAAKIGLVSDKGMLLSYQLFIPGESDRQTLASRMRPTRSSNTAMLLAEAIERPVELPREFLAKVDPTAVLLVNSISKAGFDGTVEVDPVNGDLFITVGTGTPTILAVHYNGDPFTYAGIIGTTATQVVVDTQKITSAGLYVISVEDGTGAKYGVELWAE